MNTQSKGETLLYFRKLRELTQVELSELVGITQANISSYETGNRCLGLNAAKRLAKALGIDYHLLV